MGGYADAASAYINAMADLLTEIAKYQSGLPDIIGDVEKRAVALTRAGNELMETYFKVAPLTMVSPLSYYQWLDVHNVAGVFQTLGGNMGGFAGEISERARAYDRMAESLNKELLNVSEQLNQYVP